ncbi:MAG: alcohol dehydrogenase catalytic domain-containing protein [Microlunatus sp.]|nr:alcohol dehydrogenase catalytic domain-containing protein [Microlunatus sp.]
MQALVLRDIGRFDLIEIDDPVPGPGEMRIAVLRSGVCGSELGGFLGTDGLRGPGLAFGHEFIGVVESYGPSVTAQDQLPAGTLVTANPLQSCGNCPICRSGHANVCPDRRLLGGHIQGSNADFVVVPLSAVYRLDGLAEPEACVFAEPTACALRAVGRLKLRPGNSVLVIGAGPIGLLVLEVLRRDGVADLYFTERVAGRAAAAERSGAMRLSDDPAELVRHVRRVTGGLGVDAVVDAVGSTDTRIAATSLVRPGGEVCFVGLHSADGTLPIRHLIRQEITCYTSFAYSDTEFGAAVELLGRGEINFRGEVVRAGLADGQYWYQELIKGHPVTKVLLEPPNGGTNHDQAA